MVDHQRDGEAGDDLVSWSAGEGNTRRREHTMPQGETILGSVDLFLMTSLRWTFGGSSSTGVGSNDAGLSSRQLTKSQHTYLKRHNGLNP